MIVLKSADNDMPSALPSVREIVERGRVFPPHTQKFRHSQPEPLVQDMGFFGTQKVEYAQRAIGVNIYRNLP